jgi:hypothetical protein
MQATWLRVAGVLVVSALAGVGAPGCGKDKRSSKPSCNDCGGEGGSGDGAGVGGNTVSASGSSMQPNGGAGAAANGGDAPGGTGTSEAGGAQGGTAGAGAVGGEAGGGASSADDDGEQLQICVRLANGADEALTVQRDYTSALYEDCRVRWLFPSGQAYIDLVNQVRRFNFQFWGCPATPRVFAFALVSGTPALSQGDANLLIDHYLVAAQPALDLTAGERKDMQAALARLSKPLIVDSSLDPSKPACATGGTGSGGSAGTGGVDAGGSGGASGADAGMGGTP